MNLDNLRKQAKLLVRWHREGNHSVGGRIRKLPRYSELTDVQALALPFPLREAQEIIALEAGYPSWAELKEKLEAAPEAIPRRSAPVAQPSTINRAIPVLYVSNVQAAAEFFQDQLGFAIDFLHGQPPFYGSVVRDGACLHLRFVHEPVFHSGICEREELICAFLPVDNVKALFAEYKARKVHFVQPLKKEPWGGPSFIVSDPDGNRICFAG